MRDTERNRGVGGGTGEDLFQKTKLSEIVIIILMLLIQ